MTLEPLRLCEDWNDSSKVNISDLIERLSTLLLRRSRYILLINLVLELLNLLYSRFLFNEMSVMGIFFQTQPMSEGPASQCILGILRCIRRQFFGG